MEKGGITNKKTEDLFYTIATPQPAQIAGKRLYPGPAMHQDMARHAPAGVRSCRTPKQNAIPATEMAFSTGQSA